MCSRWDLNAADWKPESPCRAAQQAASGVQLRTGARQWVPPAASEAGPPSAPPSRPSSAGFDDSDEVLRANIVANVAAYLHPASTVPTGGDSDPTAVDFLLGRRYGSC